MNRERSITLDVIRGVAILAVVGVHTMQGSLVLYPVGGPVEGDRVFTLLSYLRFGPELFFVLSGWLLFRIQAVRTETSRMYWARRFARIWPLWLVFTVITYAGIAFQWSFVPAGRGLQLEPAEYLVAGAASVFFLGWFSAVTWNIPAGGWSIQSEMGHYSLFWMLRRVTPTVLIMSVGVGYCSWIVGEVIMQSGPETLKPIAEAWIRLGLFGTWPFFVAGGLAYLWSSGRSAFTWRQGASLLVVLAFSWLVPLPFGRVVEATVVVVCLLLAALLLNRLKPMRSPVASVGRTSYFIYFAHFWVIALVVVALEPLPIPKQFEGNFGVWLAVYAVLFAVTLVISWLLSLISWKTFESPFIERARKVR